MKKALSIILLSFLLLIIAVSCAQDVTVDTQLYGEQGSGAFLLDGKYYVTLQEAIDAKLGKGSKAAGDKDGIIYLMRNLSGPGAVINDPNTPVTIDFNAFTYSFTDVTATQGSTGGTFGLSITNGADVTLKGLQQIDLHDTTDELTMVYLEGPNTKLKIEDAPKMVVEPTQYVFWAANGASLTIGSTDATKEATITGKISATGGTTEESKPTITVQAKTTITGSVEATQATVALNGQTTVTGKVEATTATVTLSEKATVSGTVSATEESKIEANETSKITGSIDVNNSKVSVNDAANVNVELTAKENSEVVINTVEAGAAANVITTMDKDEESKVVVVGGGVKVEEVAEGSDTKIEKSDDATVDTTGTTAEVEPVTTYVAKILGKSAYETIDAAFEAADKGDEIILLTTITGNVVVPEKKDVVINMKAYGFDEAVITVNGNVTVTSDSDNAVVGAEMHLKAGSSTLLESGIYNISNHTAFVEEDAELTITGGTYNFNPGYKIDKKFVPANYMITAASELGPWTVSKTTEEAAVAQIDNDYYVTLALAVYDATSGDTVLMLKNDASNDNVTVDKNLTIDLQSYGIVTNVFTVKEGFKLVVKADKNSIATATIATISLKEDSDTLLESGNYVITNPSLASDAILTITGGTYNFYPGYKIDNLFVPANYKITAASEYGPWTVSKTTEEDAVAQIDNDYYVTLALALYDAVDGDTVVLLKDSASDESLVIPEDLSITLDLNGKTIEGNVGDSIGRFAVVNKGTLIVEDTSSAKTGRIYNLYQDSQAHGALLNTEGASLTVNGGHFGSEDTRGAAVQNEGGFVVVNSGTYTSISQTDSEGKYSTARGWAYAINNIYGDMTINGGSVTMSSDGILHGGIGINGGTVVVNNIDLNSFNGKLAYNSIYIGQSADRDISVTVKDGSFRGSEINSAGIVRCYNSKDVSIEITGGTFTAKTGGIYIDLSPSASPSTNKITITGGTYNANPTAYVPAYCKVEKEGELWTVSRIDPTEAEARIGENYYKTLAAAIADFKEDDIIVLLKDINYTSVLLIDKSLTIDGDSHSIFNEENRVIRITEHDLDVKLYNLGIISKCTDDSDTRGISIDNVADNVSLLLNNCRIDADGTTRSSVIDYAINGVNDADNISLTLENSSYVKGWGAINLHGDDCIVNVKDSTLVGVNNHSGASDAFATIIIDASQYWYPSNTANNNTVNISNSVIVAKQNGSKEQYWISYQYGAGVSNTFIGIDNSTVFLSDEIDGSDKRTSMYISGDTNHVVLPLSEEQVSQVKFMYKVSATEVVGVYDVTAYSESDANVSYSNGPFADGSGPNELRTLLWIPFINEWIWPTEGLVLIDDIDLEGNSIIYKGGSASTAGILYFYFNSHSIENGVLIVNEVVTGTEIKSDTSGMTSFFIAEGYNTVETNNGDGTYSYTFVASTT